MATETDNAEMAEAIDKLTEENDELLQNVAKLREINKTLMTEKSALQKAMDRLENTLRSVKEEVHYWKGRFNKVMEFLEQHSLRKKWEEWVRPKKNKVR